MDDCTGNHGTLLSSDIELIKYVLTMGRACRHGHYELYSVVVVGFSRRQNLPEDSVL